MSDGEDGSDPTSQQRDPLPRTANSFLAVPSRALPLEPSVRRRANLLWDQEGRSQMQLDCGLQHRVRVKLQVWGRWLLLQ